MERAPGLCLLQDFDSVVPRVRHRPDHGVRRRCPLLRQQHDPIEALGTANRHQSAGFTHISGNLAQDRILPNRACGQVRLGLNVIGAAWS